MIKIQCHTNLDLERCEIWPSELPEVPREGDLIQSGHKWPYYDGRQIELRVVRVTWKVHVVTERFGVEVPYIQGCDEEKKKITWLPSVELHLPPNRFESIIKFYEWYGKITGKGVHAYI